MIMELIDFMHECWQEEKRIAKEEKDSKRQFRRNLKGLINITGLYRYLDETQEWWLPIDIVEITNTGEKKHGYPDYDTCRILNSDFKYLFLKQRQEEIRGINHEYVYQSGRDDSYWGYLLFPLKNGKYLIINFNC